jgi:hypothetical protein
MKRDRGYLPLYVKLLGYPQTGNGGNATHGYYGHFSVGEFQMGGSRFRLPTQVGEILIMTNGVHLRGVHASVTCVSHRLQ